MKRLFANALAFLVIAAVGLLYIHNYEVWWSHRGRAAYMAFQSSFFDQSVTTLQISGRLLSVVLLGALFLWVIFEVISRVLLLLLSRTHRRWR